MPSHWSLLIFFGLSEGLLIRCIFLFVQYISSHSTFVIRTSFDLSMGGARRVPVPGIIVYSAAMLARLVAKQVLTAVWDLCADALEIFRVDPFLGIVDNYDEHVLTAISAAEANHFLLAFLHSFNSLLRRLTSHCQQLPFRLLGISVNQTSRPQVVQFVVPSALGISPNALSKCYGASFCVVQRLDLEPNRN